MLRELKCSFCQIPLNLGDQIEGECNDGMGLYFVSTYIQQSYQGEFN